MALFNLNGAFGLSAMLGDTGTERQSRYPSHEIDGKRILPSPVWGRSHHVMPHGEAFLSIMQNRLSDGLFIRDEPESALSPKRQLTLLALMDDLASQGQTQFLIATHSAIPLTYLGDRIVSFIEEQLTSITLAETSHYQITRGILQSPESYWKHLRNPDGDCEVHLTGGSTRLGAANPVF